MSPRAEEDRTIPTCRLRAALTASVFALALPGGVFANVPDAAVSLADYARARLADASGELGAAAQGYASALAASEGDRQIAERAYRRAMAAGDRALAADAARHLTAAEARPIDLGLFELAGAVERRDWAGARAIVDTIEQEGVFDAIVPVLRAWIAFGAEDGDPLAALAPREDAPLPDAYAIEHRALLLLALGRYEEGVAAIRAIQQVGGARATRLRLAAAALLQRRDQRDEALALLDGEDRALVAGRAEIERRRRLPGAIDSSASGIAELYVRLSSDINRSSVQPVSLALARLATMLARENGPAWVITAALLAQGDQHATALAALDHVAAGDPFYDEAVDMRVRLLVDRGEREAALAAAVSHVGGRGVTADDWSRVGELQAGLERYGEAAESYRRALNLARAAAGPGTEEPWAPWLLYGGALLDGGRWEEARPALERAVELAPNQPVVLNYLGYAMLERRIDLPRAEELIRRASDLRPDNAAIVDSLGWVHYVQGDLTNAIPALERAARGDPAEPTINEHLGDAYWTAGRRMEARFAWQAALVAAEDDASVRLRAKLERGLTPETASP